MNSISLLISNNHYNCVTSPSFKVCEINKVGGAVAREFHLQREIRGTSCTANRTHRCKTENTTQSRVFRYQPGLKVAPKELEFEPTNLQTPVRCLGSMPQLFHTSYYNNWCIDSTRAAIFFNFICFTFSFL